MIYTEKDKELINRCKLCNGHFSQAFFKKKLTEEDYKYLENRFTDTHDAFENFVRLWHQIDKAPICELDGCNNICEFRGYNIDIKYVYNKSCCHEHSRLIAQKKTAITKKHDNVLPDIKGEITDEIVKSLIKYRSNGITIDHRSIKTLPKNVVNYINNRYNDSESFNESLIRIIKNIEHRPKCKLDGCNNTATLRYVSNHEICFNDCCCFSHASELGSKTSSQNILERTNGKYSNVNQLPEKRKQQSEKYHNKSDEEKQAIKDKRAATNLATIGYENYFQSPEIIERIAQDCYKKTGYYHYSQTPEAIAKSKEWAKEHKDELIEATKQGFIKKYGVDNPMKVSEIIEKMKINSILHNGTLAP